MKNALPIFLCLVVLLFSAGGAAAENGCVVCHQKQKEASRAGHNFSDWKQSPHAARGIACEACHGGNPGTTDPVKAHQGVVPSTDKKSSVYFQNVAETCGKCHPAEYEEFRKSAHYRMLKNTGKGPNCLTCHGAMAIRVLQYNDLEKTCSLCHGKPQKAATALSMLHSVKRSLELYEKNSPREGEKIKMFRKRYQTLQEKWHSFDIEDVTEQAEKLIKDLTQAEKQLRHVR